MRRADIEGLRAVAVGLVVAYHAGWQMLPGGFVGVDVFFVISGFLITGLLADELTHSGTLSLARFYGRRARRLLPMSTLVLAVTAVAFAAVISPLSHQVLGADVRAAALYVANWHFAFASLDYLTGSAKSPVLHYWSLSVEEQFYLVWPLVLLGTAWIARRRNSQPSLARWFVVALGALGAASLAASVAGTGSTGPFAYFGLHTRAWELAAGGLLALGARQGVTIPAAARRAAGWTGLGAVVASAAVIDGSTTFPGIAAAWPVVATMLVVAAGGPGTTPGAGRLLGSRPLTYVGRLSYSWYLWHWPCLMFAGCLALGVQRSRGAAVLPIAHGWPAVAAVAASLALSVLGHHTIEDPVRRSAWLGAVRRRSLALGAGLTAAAVATAGVVLPASTGAAAGPVTAPVGAFVRHPGGATSATVVDATVSLRGSPATERNDFPRGDGHCYASYQSIAAPADCTFGDPRGTTSIAVVGDSHAQQWFAALQQAAEREHWRLSIWTKPACPFVDLPVRLATFRNSYPWCTAWRQSVLDRLRAAGPFDAVVVANFSGADRYVGRFASRGGAPLARAAVPGAWGTAWRQTLRSLRPDAKRVILMRDIPQPSTDVPYCLAAHGSDATPCAFDRTAAFTDVDRILAAEQRSSGRPLPVLDVDDVVCPGDPCPVLWRDGTIMYSDAHHLTGMMTAKLIPVLATRLHHLLRAM
ncbi:MAG TPA: acyltransferase family protein [Mycobacteriales bacterium]|nr:acyltransferase family protein [Mycobacteriales bacterium]